MIGNGMGGLQADAFSFMIEKEDIEDVDLFLTKCSIYYSNLLKGRQED